MTEEEALQILRDTGAIMQGHFLLSSGRHSDTYVEKFRALEKPSVAAALGAAIAERFTGIDVVVAPAVGGIVLGFATATALGARFIFSEREGGAMRLRRGFRIEEGERVLAVEDIVTTGKSLLEVLSLLPSPTLAGIGCMVDRSNGSLKTLLPLQSLVRMEVSSWEPGECPLCAERFPLQSPGSRHSG